MGRLRFADTMRICPPCTAFVKVRLPSERRDPTPPRICQMPPRGIVSLSFGRYVEVRTFASRPDVMVDKTPRDRCPWGPCSFRRRPSRSATVPPLATHRTRSPSELSISLDTVGVFSPDLLRTGTLKAFLGARQIVFRPDARCTRRVDAVVGWGRSGSTESARAFARRRGVRYIALGDGFLRSLGGIAGERPLSLVLDDIGIHYDARSPSRLELMLSGNEAEDALAAATGRARACRARLREARGASGGLALPSRRSDEQALVLVVDQAADDPSVAHGLAEARTFARMLEAARDEHPRARIVVATYSSARSAGKRSYLSDVLPPGIERLSATTHPMRLLPHVDHVYVCTSDLGFDALLAEKPVRCFGAPFYAGWGLTRDETSLSRRGRARTLDELTAAALLLYPRYVHPVHRQRCEAEDIVEHLALQHRTRSQNERRFHCVNFSVWKRPFVRKYLAATGDTRATNVRFVRSARELEARVFDAADTVVLWGARPSAPQLLTSSGAEVPVWRMEDGFLRSVGLGSDRAAPGSLVLDRRGLYYDPTDPSDLEELLMSAHFTPDELRQAARLREAIVAHGISKYNLDARRWFRPRSAPGQRVVLTVGQVDDDASVELARSAARSNADLLRAVRALRPDAHLVYKPHPDVLAGNRRGMVNDPSAWDESVVDAALDACLAHADEVHTISSLVGFEALLRGVPVITYGQPFYSGWGLTEDRAPLPRRTRRLTLDELVAGTLVRYPRYYSHRAQAFCAPEDMVAELARLRDTPGPRLPFPRLRRRLQDLAILTSEWLRG